MIRSAGTKHPQSRHDGWPVLRQCIRNVRVQYDSFGNPSSEKDKAAGRIDALIATQMAVSGIMDILREPKSAYEVELTGECIGKPVFVTSYCNLHDLWLAEIKLEA